MSKAEARVATSQPVGAVARTSVFIDRIRPVVLILGFLVLGAAFGLAAWAIQKDYLLRAAGLWTGATGTAHGTAAHASNKAMAEFAVDGIQWATVALGFALLIPRREEGAFFRWSAWLCLLFAVVFLMVAFLGLLGLGLHDVAVSFDPTCTIDGPCDHPPKPMPPLDWRLNYLGGLAVAATFIAAILSTCLGVRWMFWVFVWFVRKVRSA